MHILRASVVHLNDIVGLNRVVHNLHVEHEPRYFRPFEEAAVTESIRNALGDPSVTFLLAVDGEKPVGYAMLRAQDRAGHAYALPRRFVELEQIAVDPDSRKRGVGTALIDETFAVAKSLDLCDLELSVWHFNEDARRLFHRKGFKSCLHRMRTQVPE